MFEDAWPESVEKEVLEASTKEIVKIILFCTKVDFVQKNV